MPTRPSPAPSASVPRTLAEQLRAWPDARLAALLRARPDLIRPAPQDCAQLASRAGTRSSVLRAAESLTAADLAVVDALVALGGSAPLSRLHEVLAMPADDVTASVRVLQDRALIWGEDDALRVVTALAEAVGTPVSGLRDLPPGRSVAEEVEARGGRTTVTALPPLPEAATSPIAASLVDRAGAGAAAEFCRHVEHLLDRWGVAPPGVLRGGGLAVRDLRATASYLQTDETVAALVVEVAAGAGLVAEGLGADGEPAWLPTDAYDAWSGADLGARWEALARAWLDDPRLRGATGPDRKPVNVLAPGNERTWLAETRRMTLEVLASLEPGRVLATGTGPASVVERLRWLRPRRPPERGGAAARVLDEAAALGVTGLGGLTGCGRALLGDDDAAALLQPLLPPPLDHVLLQADLTAVAPGPLVPDLAASLASVADVESRGAATVYRFTASSIRRAFDVGWSAHVVHDLLAQASRTPVPQGLTYLVDDVARRFGSLRVGVAESFLRSDDEAALAALVRDPRAAALGLRSIAPTVVVSTASVSTVLARLRELGLAPVVEAADGTVRLARPDLLRARVARRGREAGRTAPARAEARRTAEVAAVVTALRAGEAARASRPGPQRAIQTPADVVAALREAVEARASVWIEYVDGDGRTRELVVDPYAVEAGLLAAHDHRSDSERQFSLHRIRGVRSLP